MVQKNYSPPKFFNEQVGELVNEYKKSINWGKNAFHSRYNITDLFLDDYDYDN